jgi:hypothetical protein
VPAGWEVVKTFTGDAGGATTGSLDLRTYTGPIHVVGWDQAGYAITVLTKKDDSQHLGEHGVDPVFTQSSDDGLGLKLVVQPRGTNDISFGSGGTDIGSDGAPVAVIANVPASIAWQKAFVCSGASGGMGFDIPLPFDQPPSQDEPKGCVQVQQSFNAHLGTDVIGRGDEKSNSSNPVPFAIENLHGGSLGVNAQYANLGLVGLTFEEAKLATQYGSVTLKTTVDKLAAHSQYGSIKIQVLGGGSGTYDLASQYGNIQLQVPHAAQRGYDATGTAQYGKVTIKLSDAEATPEDGEPTAPAGTSAAASPLGALPLMGESKDPSSHGGRHGQSQTAKAKSADFDAKAVQVKVTSAAQYGDILITDGALPKAPK